MVLNVGGRTDIVLYCPLNEGTGTTAYDYNKHKGSF